MEFVDEVVAAGVDALIVHARAAILGGLASNAQALPGQPTRGLTPKENREIPPLKYDYVHRLKAARPALPVVINGGFTELPSIVALAGGGLDGVMLGRAAYHNPVLLAEVERAVINPAWRIPQPAEIIDDMVSYARREAAVGVRLHSITRHMHGLMAGREGGCGEARRPARDLIFGASRPKHRFGGLNGLVAHRLPERGLPG
jgi:tRNA-dihydrouridine synthase A